MKILIIIFVPIINVLYADHMCVILSVLKHISVSNIYSV